jgi:S-DNA-T family DNA segregation ATPase FtsK/SpoIIIE
MLDLADAGLKVSQFVTRKIDRLVNGWQVLEEGVPSVLADLPGFVDKDALWFVLGQGRKETRFECLDLMPHLLVAGTTGSGKSVFLNVLLASLLVRHGPDSLRIGLVDPKMVEFAMYRSLPHLLGGVMYRSLPHLLGGVIPDDIEGASVLMAGAVDQMQKRLELFVRMGVKDLASYNKVSKEKLPRWVLVVDEFADLIMASKKDKVTKGFGESFERDIVRIAQKARATGIHLVLSTQKPIVKVVDTLLKGNIPSRVAFKVANRMDSKVILDEDGAERLMGKGDMLFKSVMDPDLEHLQGVYLNDSDLRRVIAGRV